MKTKAPRFVFVTWHDAHGSATGYYDQTRDHQPAPVETAGWLLKRDERGVSIANERHTADEGDGFAYRGHTFIPSAMVVSIKARPA